jgi:outer membrane protein assembly factor BamE (lipoprotein component of BamABCDE complex)
MSTAQPFGRILLAGLLASGLVACAPQVDTRGNLPDPETVLEVQPGVHDRDQVATILGSPSTVATFEDDTWYYISRRTEKIAFFEPEVVDQQVLVVKFGQDGLVADMAVYGMEDGQVIEPVERTTPTSGRELTILQQLFGNIGRFNTGEEGQ